MRSFGRAVYDPAVSRKGKRAQRPSQKAPETPDSASSADTPSDPLFRGPVELALFGVVTLTVCLVALWFSLSVNRVFDVPKALALKAGGGGAFLVWLLYALFGKGIAWRSIRLFIVPVTALTSVVIISTFLSLDIPTSIYGVYERQFGLQGFLGCVGLFVVCATCLKDRRGAVVALSILAILGGLIGTYSYLQSTGQDPYPFFYEKPHNKVYSFLGNATFAGNSLALILPISTILSLVAIGVTHRRSKRPPEETILWCLLGAGLVLFLQIGPGVWAASEGMPQEKRESLYQLGVAISLGFLVSMAAIGSWGPNFVRAQTHFVRSIADRMMAGGLLGAVIGILMGLLFTRTRGAWVGSAIAFAGGLVLLPLLLRGQPSFKPVLRVCLGILALGSLLMTIFFIHPKSVCHDPKGKCMLIAQTIRSIPAAFDPKRQDFGPGQGTRMYLWSEMPRVLVHHDQTLDRMYDDQADYAAHVEHGLIKGLELAHLEAPSEQTRAFDKAWRRISVWLFGIGIETYRYAFMSHKSKRLEALDPMTNHDNPHNNYLYVLASFGLFGLAAYLWLLWRLLSVAFFRFVGWVEKSADGTPYTLVDRAIAFGVVTSFFSYAVYSIAGFDSVACSVFFYFLLGAAAVYLEPNENEPLRPLGAQVLHHAQGGKDPSIFAHPVVPTLLSSALALILGGLLLNSVWGGITVFRAEHAFVAIDEPRPRDPATFLARKVEDTLRAIKIHPYESYYRQSLGGTYLQGGRYYQRGAQQMLKEGKVPQSEAGAQRARQYFDKARTALYSALHHGWAPENVFISLFQVDLASRASRQAERDLERALVHSPHLGAVRANLALLELERKAYVEALHDCQWVLEVDPKSVMALKTCGRALFELSRFNEAETYLVRAQKIKPNDPTIKTALEELHTRKEKKATTSTHASSST